MESLVVWVSIADSRLAAAVSGALSAQLGAGASMVAEPRGEYHARIVERGALAPPRNGELIVGVGSEDASFVVGAFAEHPWLNHFVTYQSLETEAGAYVVARTIRGALRDRSAGTTPFLGRRFRGRKARVRDAALRWRCIDAVLRAAEDAGAKGSALQKIGDVSEELLTNALYNAPAERYGTLDRTARRVLARPESCTLTYGASGPLFLLRATDPFGTLRRDRLLEVLRRCAAGAGVALDVSSGGAGLGWWRIVSSAELLIVRVRPGVSTEVLVGVRLRRSARGAGAPSIHLFFDEEPAEVST